MKLKKDFTIYNMADEYMLIPTGDQMGSFGGTVVLNDVSAFILEQMKEEHKTEAQLLAALTGAYDVDEATAKADLVGVLKTLKGYGVIEE